MYACTLSLQGLPLPSQEFNAVDVVVRYAVSGLGFAFEDIILFAWSIGKWLMGGALSPFSFCVSLVCTIVDPNCPYLFLYRWLHRQLCCNELS